MNDPMRILKQDHREAKQLLTALAESEEGSERQKMAKELEKALTLHMELEERLLYPLVKEHVGEEDEEEAEIEHRLAREGLRQMMSMVDQPGFGAAVEMVKGGIEHHVQEEETEILPELKEAISREQWTSLGEQLTQAKAAAGMPVKEPKRTNNRRSSKRKKATASSRR
jgi:hemerythrin-like domain-containing protein